MKAPCLGEERAVVPSIPVAVGPGATALVRVRVEAG